jgi:hypothetical protein
MGYLSLSRIICGHFSYLITSQLGSVFNILVSTFNIINNHQNNSIFHFSSHPHSNLLPTRGDILVLTVSKWVAYVQSLILLSYS